VWTQVSAAYSVSSLKAENFYDADAGRQLLVHETLGDSQGLVHKAISKARMECDAMCTEMHEIESNADKDAFLLQRFITDSLKGMERTLAFRFFFPELGGGVHTKWKSYICLLALLAYVVFCSMYVFLFGVVLGPSAVNMWLQSVIIAFLQMMLILDPFKCFVMFVVLSYAPSRRIRFIHAVLRDRAKAIVSRNVGVVRDANSLVQHLSPACRTARQFPHLSMSRLLLSLNDHDIPINFLLDESKNRTWVTFLFKAVAWFMFIASLVVILVLPEIVGDSVMEVLSNLFVNLSIGVGYYITQAGGTVALPIGLAVAIIVLYVTYEYTVASGRDSQNHVWHLRALNTVAKKSDEDDQDDRDELDKSIDAVLKEKHTIHQGWRARLALTKSARMLAMVAPGSPEVEKQKLRLNLKAKAAPSVLTLVQQGIIPDIFSTSPAKKDLDDTIKESIVSKYAKKYHAMSPAAVQEQSDRFAAVGDVIGFSRKPSSKALRRAGSSSNAKNLLEIHLSDTSGEDAPMHVRLKTAVKGTDKDTEDLFSLFADVDSDDIKASVNARSGRSSLRTKRQKSKKPAGAGGGAPAGGGLAGASDASFRERRAAPSQSLAIEDLFSLDGEAYESEYSGAASAPSPVQIAERAKRRAKRKQLKAAALPPVIAAGGRTGLLLAPALPGGSGSGVVPALNLAKHLVTPVSVIQDDFFVDDDASLAGSFVKVRTVQARRKLGRRSSGRSERFSDESGVESDDMTEKTDVDFLFSDVGDARDVIPAPSRGVHRFTPAERAPSEVSSDASFDFGSLLDDDDDAKSAGSRVVSRHRRGARSSGRDQSSHDK